MFINPNNSSTKFNYNNFNNNNNNNINNNFNINKITNQYDKLLSINQNNNFNQYKEIRKKLFTPNQSPKQECLNNSTNPINKAIPYIDISSPMLHPNNQQLDQEKIISRLMLSTKEDDDDIPPAITPPPIFLNNDKINLNNNYSNNINNSDCNHTNQNNKTTINLNNNENNIFLDEIHLFTISLRDFVKKSPRKQIKDDEMNIESFFVGF
ncbi:hypothetical protein DICPUDRAFT_76298 [Dictyostelium purpureum]|uniref:Uncharacterized protein n=1 Tax=Dictyostelium purpureum TaxID=5786 RepID=F0ZD70_DICPU|nr:uncharacterized protein DICPUDRAFT_76298 [Dictyostelium purpureum]EGC38150.1 hypothetical protein DICPUDRAFT_76298 [Dictyostelium purpureum]|eukprot:XP_003285364.1 hypothetical protein DICPUDRAFT_76298 [Dictyostelium purpureum]